MALFGASALMIALSPSSHNSANLAAIAGHIYAST
jgi:hypothetical protein